MSSVIIGGGSNIDLGPDYAVIGGGGSNTLSAVIGGGSNRINMARGQEYRYGGPPINPHCEIHYGANCTLGLGCKQCIIKLSFKTLCVASSHLVVSKTIDVIVADCKSLIIKNCIRCIFLFCEFDVYQDGVGLLFIGGERFDLDEEESIAKAKNLYWKLLRTSGGNHMAIGTTNKWANEHLRWINDMRGFLRDKAKPVEPAEMPGGDGEI